MSVLALDLLIGAEHAGQVVGARVRDLITQDALPEAVAYRLVCEAVLASDPWILAETGQVWTLRPHADTGLPGELYIATRHEHAQLTVEDEYGQRSLIPLHHLAAYELARWHWARD